jgi:hypothetical protein
MFEILENQKMLEGKVNVTLIPPDLRSDNLTQFLTAGQAVKDDPGPSASSRNTSTPPVPGT